MVRASPILTMRNPRWFPQSRQLAWPRLDFAVAVARMERGKFGILLPALRLRRGSQA
jgi:hypothetical protein